MTTNTFQTDADFIKVDESLGLVMGYAVVCKRDGEDYYDLQGDHIPEQSMLEAATEFMAHATGCVMHERDDDDQVVKGGTVVFAWPMTTDIAKSLGIETATTGLLVAIRPDDPEVLAKAQSGEYRGFSIGGTRIQDEVIDG